MRKNNSWEVNEELYERVKEEISKWPDWKKEYYEEAYIQVGKAYYDESTLAETASRSTALYLF